MRYKIISTEPSMDGYTPTLNIFARGEDGKRYTFRKGKMPVYCYTKEYPKFPDKILESRIKHVFPGYKSIYGEELYRVEMTEPRDLYQVRKHITTFEGDIPWNQRVLIDMGLKDGFLFERKTQTFTPVDVSDIRPRVWTLDIEIIDSPNIPTWKQPYYPVVCIVVHDNFTEQSYTFSMKEDNEVTMFTKFSKFLQDHDPDILTGWNVDFDISYIIGRMEHLRKYFPQMLSPMKKAYVMESRDLAGKPIFTNMKIAGRVIFDALKAYKTYKNPSGKLASYNLKTISEIELGYTYEDFGAQTTTIWKEDPDKILEYCKNDVEATKGIIEKNNLIELYSAICAISGCSLEKSMSKEAITDSYLLRISGNEILPTRDTGKNSAVKDNADEDTELKGGMVLEPETGMQEGIACFDAAGLYPSIMIGFNISPECKDENGSISIDDDRGITYRFKSKSERVGIVPKICIDFKHIRKESKKKKADAGRTFGEDSPEYNLAHQYDVAVKTVMNGVYGVVGNPSFRLFDLQCANAITAVGRNVINGLSKTLSSLSFPTVYGDTDSVFVKVSKFENVPKAKSIIESFLEENLSSWGVDKDAIDVAFEKYFTRLLFKRREIRKNVWKPVKKKYVGHMTFSDDHVCDTLYIRGFETRRSDTSKVLNKTMMRFFEIVVQENKLQDGIKLIKDLKNDFIKIDPYEIAVPRAMHKQLESSPWFRGMRYAQQNCGYSFDEETAPRLLYVKRVIGDHPATDAFCIQEGMKIPDWIEIDYDTMFEKVIKKKFYPIFHELEINWNKEFEGQYDLDEWF